jgi:hypothetical protein
MKRLLSAFLIALLAAGPALAEVPRKIPENTMNLGHGAATDKTIVADKGLGSTNPKVKFNVTTGKWQFSNDGTNFKDLGSGAGGGSGINFLQDSNPDFEQGTTGWTASAGSFTIATSGSSWFHDLKTAVWDPSAAAQTFCSTAITVASSNAPGLAGANGSASLWLKTTATDYTLGVYDGSTLVASRTVPALTFFQQIAVSFPIPSSGGVLKTCLTSGSDAAAIAVDDASMGSTNVFSLSMAQFVGSAVYPNTASCLWVNSAAGSFATFSTVSACPAPTVTGLAVSVDDNLPQIKFTSLPAGEYLVMASGQMECSAGTNCGVTISDGTTNDGNYWAQQSNAGTPERPGFTVSGRFTYSNSGARTFMLYGARSSGTQNLYNNQGGQNETQFKVYRFPSLIEQAVKPDQYPASWTGYHDGTCSWARTNNAYADPAADSTCVFAERTNRNFGTVTSYLSGSDKLPGIVFTPPRIGRYHVCASYSAISSTNTVGYSELSDLNGNVLDRPSNESPSAQSLSHHIKSCGVLPVTSASAVTVRLRLAASGAGTQTVSPLNSSLQNTIEWEVTDYDAAQGSPVLVGSVNSNSVGTERIERASVLADTACVINKQSGSWLGSPTSCSAGLATFALSGFSDRPACVVALENSTGIVACRARSLSQTALTVECLNSATGAATAGNASVICMGPR